MKFRIVQFNRKSETGAQLQLALELITAQEGAIERLEVQEDDSRIYFMLALGDKRAQTVKVFGIDKVEVVESEMDKVIAGMTSVNITAMTVLPIGNQRALGAIVAEAVTERSDVTDSKSRKKTTRKQNSNLDAGADGGAKAESID